MEKWVVQLGREHELCECELRQVASLHGAQVRSVGESLAEVTLGGEDCVPSVEPMMEALGGAIRAIAPMAEWTDGFEARFRDQRMFLPHGPWGVSALSPQLGSEREKVRQLVRGIVSEDSEAHGRELRAAPGSWEIVPTKVFEKGLAREGAEICLWRDGEGTVQLGTTRWVFSPEGFAFRDVKKPYRPQRRGLMPPKLARQMINMVRTGESGSILDPFCGSGVTLLEGLSLGLQVAGSDNRGEAISQTRKNLDWFLESNNGGSPESVLFLERMDVRQISTKLAPLSIDAVVAEGDLGPPIRGRLSRKAAVEFRPRLEQLYTAAFAEIRTVLKPGGRVSLAVPFWQPNEGDPIFLNLERKLRLIGYRPAILERGFEPITYRRKDQRVGRAIYVLESPEN
jgi:tRNA G10  N-methylase Trm11